MRAKLSLAAALLASCTHGGQPPDCAVDAGTDGMADPWVDAFDVDPRCAWLRPDELTEFSLTNLPYGWLGPQQLALDGAVAHADFVGPLVADPCHSYIRYRIGLDGVVTLTDHACSAQFASIPTTNPTPGGLCRVDEARDIEVHTLLQPLDIGGDVDGPLLRVLRHSTGEILFTFGEGLGTGPTPGYPNFVRGRVFLAPERSSDPACCPSGSCRVGPCGTQTDVPEGCRWEDRVNDEDGFCHAVVVF